MSDSVGFYALGERELQQIDGGIDWDSVGNGIATAGGAYIGGVAGGKIGAAIGTAFGPVGTVAGGIVGGVLGCIVYTLWD